MAPAHISQGSPGEALGSMLWKVIILGIAAGMLLPTAQAQIDTAVVSAPSTGEARFLALTNSERALRGARPLRWDETLCRAGRQHSQEMATLAYFDHRSPVRGLESPADRWEAANPKAPAEYSIAENIFYGSVADVTWSHRSLMNSPDHRANILNPRYTHMGVGVYVSASGEMWVTEMFVS